MSIVPVLDQSETDFCGINEEPINLSILINTFPHGQTNIYQTWRTQRYLWQRVTR